MTDLQTLLTRLEEARGTLGLIYFGISVGLSFLWCAVSGYEDNDDPVGGMILAFFWPPALGIFVVAAPFWAVWKMGNVARRLKRQIAEGAK